MVNYREINYQEDIPEVVELLSENLSSKHSFQSFLWKHKENPFGKSLGILALDKEKIIGVRMFMQWELRKDQELIKAIRPVDTVTHPNYRRNGIFKELNLRGLEHSKGNYDLIFNTPNKNSLSGNLKMGWKKYSGELNFRIAYISPLNNPNYIEFLKLNDISIIPEKWEIDFYRTNITKDYLLWRYGNEDYKVASFRYNSELLFLIYRLEQIRGISMIVMIEIIGDLKLHGLAVKSLSSKLRIYLVHYLTNKSSNIDFTFSKKRNSAVLVYREDYYNIIEEINFSLGDIEGRL